MERKKEEEKEKEGKKERNLPFGSIPQYFPKPCVDCGQAPEWKLGARTPFQVSHMGGRNPVTGSTPSAAQSVLRQEAGINCTVDPNLGTPVQDADVPRRA